MRNQMIIRGSLAFLAPVLMMAAVHAAEPVPPEIPAEELTCKVQTVQPKIGVRKAFKGTVVTLECDAEIGEQETLPECPAGTEPQQHQTSPTRNICVANGQKKFGDHSLKLKHRYIYRLKRLPSKEQAEKLECREGYKKTEVRLTGKNYFVTCMRPAEKAADLAAVDCKTLNLPEARIMTWSVRKEKAYTECGAMVPFQEAEGADPGLFVKHAVVLEK